MIGWFSLLFLISIVMSGVLTWMVRHLAIARGWTSLPSSARHIHCSAIPRLGGVAIFLTFIFAPVIALTFAGFMGGTQGLPTHRIASIQLPAILMFVVGIADDFIDLRPRVKLAFQIFGALCLYFAGLTAIHSTLVVHGLPVGQIIGAVSTVAWVVCISNGLNIIDGVDGLAGGSALFSLSIILTLALLNGRDSIALLSVVLAGALIGFLKFNVHPASIFLGDNGSLFIGFVLSAMALGSKSNETSPLAAACVLALAFGFPILETTVSVLRRFISGRKIFEADRAHIHHRLLELGLSQWQVVGVLYAFSAVCAVVSLVLIFPEPLAPAVVLSLFSLAVILGLRRLGYSEFKEFKRMWYRMTNQKRALANNVAVRTAATRLSSARDFDDIYAALKESLARTGVGGFELLIAAAVPSAHEGAVSISKPLYCSLNGDAGRAQLKQWVFGVDLIGSKLGPLGQFRMRGAAHETIEFDLNVLLHELQPSLSAAVEHACFNESRRQTRHLAGPRVSGGKQRRAIV